MQTAKQKDVAANFEKCIKMVLYANRKNGFFEKNTTFFLFAGFGSCMIAPAESAEMTALDKKLNNRYIDMPLIRVSADI